jgi:hypothetical protein
MSLIEDSGPSCFSSANGASSSLGLLLGTTDGLDGLVPGLVVGDGVVLVGCGAVPSTNLSYFLMYFI